MKPRKILSLIMALLMAVSMLPSLVFAAEPSDELGGRLKIKGVAAVGGTLTADYTKVTPEGVTDDDVTFQWSRKLSETEEPVEVGTEKEYTLTEEDLGYKIILKVTGNSDMGMSGELTANTIEIAATAEEAPEDPTELTDEEKAAEAAGTAEQSPEDTTAGDGMAEAISGDIVIDENTNEPVTGEPETEPYTADSAQSMAVSEDSDIQTDDSVLDIGVEESLNYLSDEVQELSYSAEIYTDNENGTVDFGTVEAGYEEAPEAQYVTIVNTGSGSLTFDSIAPEHFMVQDVETPLESGQSVTLWIQPRAGVEAGTYADVITYTTAEGVSVSFEADLTVAEALEPLAVEEAPETVSEKIPDDASPEALTLIDEPGVEATSEAESAVQADSQESDTTGKVVSDKTELTFDSLTVGDTPSAQEIILTNSGSEAALVTVSGNNSFDVLDADGNALTESTAVPANDGTADGTLTLRIQPKADLAEGSYTDTITVKAKDDEIVVTAAVTVTAAENVTADTDVLDFGTLTAGYTPEAQAVTLTNEGNTDVTVTVSGNSSFDVLDADGNAVASAVVGAAGSLTLKVQPKAGLTAGTYQDVITLTGGAQAVVITAAVVVTDPPVYGLSVDPTAIDFEGAEVGYTQPEAVTVTVTNTGNTTVNLTQPTGTSFIVGSLSTASLAAGGTAVFTIQPNAGLLEGVYEETIIVAGENAEAAVNVSFVVTEANVELTGITSPEAITDLGYGTEKSADGLSLPSTVVITTTQGEMKAAVSWDVKSSAYSVTTTEKQIFTVKGTVTLPDGVTNPDNISLVTSIQVTVNGRTAVVADPANNTISGISSSGAYTTETKITITATGAGMDNTDPGTGDIRYIPASWKVLETRSWDSAPYTATFRMGKGGSYTLEVVFNQQKYDGSAWQNTGAQDTKQVSFTVADVTVTGASLTPAVTSTDADQKNAVQTGDDTPIMSFVIVLVVAVAVIVGIVIYRKKKK